MNTEDTQGAASLSERIGHAVEHAAHVLPQQAPIRVFVHHNTLHAFEDLPFEQAVLKGAALFGTQPYESQAAFARHLASGRILPQDIDAVVQELVDPAEHPEILPGGLDWPHYVAFRLRHLFEVPEGAALQWLLREGDALVALHPWVSAEAAQRFKEGCAAGQSVAQGLQQLWDVLGRHAPPPQRHPVGVRLRDRVLAATGQDIDELVHPLLTRVCAAYVDQGVSYWSMPGRERGLLEAFRDLYALGAAPPDPWLEGLPNACVQQRAQRLDAQQTSAQLLASLKLHAQQLDGYVEATLLALRGWAGMIRQLEERPDRAPVKAPPARLVDYLAVQLTLEDLAMRHVLARHGLRLADVLGATPPARSTDPLVPVYEAFVMAQLAGLGPAHLHTDPVRGAWVAAAERASDVYRRRLLHEAYERRHRVGVLDGLLSHASQGNGTRSAPAVQAVFCIDDREESLRRHLEEVFPQAETYGYAGFFGVAMAYEGLMDIHATPLCPVAIRPRHLVVERPLVGAADGPPTLRVLGVARRSANVASQTLVRGSLFTTVLGWASLVPLVARSLFPRLAEWVPHALEHALASTPATRLVVERCDGGTQPGPDGLLPGYTVAEMAQVVKDALVTMGMNAPQAPLVVMVGHGSSSLNNPHESAHDCGATGGGRGGPNARAFAVMANHPQVREALASEGVQIPSDTWFVGAYHNTANDSMTWFDVDLVPSALQPTLAAFQQHMDRACVLDAHERCRRFETASLNLPLKAARAHAQLHAVDLGQPRPEYGHATNAVCFVGRRTRTRGLFMDRRAFLVSYDPETDSSGNVLGALLASVAPVGAGISLEYYFSFVDPVGYGCGTKLPHNIVGLVGVMDGHASDLRTGLPWQMVEIHEPVRLLTIVEAEPQTLVHITTQRPGVARLVANRWIQLVAWSPSTGQMSVFRNGEFVPYRQQNLALPSVARSMDHYRGHREHLPCARIETGLHMESGVV